MSNSINFEINGRRITAEQEETIWQVADRLGIEIPHLCYLPEKNYRADGNCRACMVEISGERTLAASCIRYPTEGMVVNTASKRAKKSREMVFELLHVDQPRLENSHDSRSKFWGWVNKIDINPSDRYPAKTQPKADKSHTAISVHLDSCIQCNLCVQACREVQSNDVIGIAHRGHHSKIIFDFDTSMGNSTCVACGECVQACPTGALMESNLLNKNGVRTKFEDHSVKTLCPYCGVGCQTNVHVKDNKILYVDGRDGPANNSRLCVKGRFGFDYAHHPDRLKTPLIRRDDAPKDAHIQIPQNKILSYFREATWDEALNRAASGLKIISDKEPGTSIAGFGSAKCSNEEAYLFQKLIRQGFISNNVDHCTRLCHASSVAALMEGLNSGAVTAPFKAAEDADCIIVIGARPAENHPVAATYIKNAAKHGAELIVIDPRGQSQGIARHASHVLQFKPGSDVSLLNALLHTIIKENLYNEQYVKQNTEGFENLKSKIIQFPPEKMEKICGIPAETIKQIARIYAKSQASIIFWGMGISQHVHGTDNARCLIALALITGQIGRPGTGLHPLRGQNNVQGASDAGLIPMLFPDYMSVEDDAVRSQYEKLWGTKLNSKKGLTVVEIINAIHDNEIKGMYIQGENPAMSDPDQKHARAALAKLEHLVVQDIFLTETAWHADVILPATAHAEKSGTFTNTNREIQMARAVIAPPGEARQDWELIQDIANRIGLNWNYHNLSDVFSEMTKVMPSLNNITWDRLQQEEYVTTPCDGPKKPGKEILFESGFPTNTGLGKIVPAQITPPSELPDENYPMVLTTGRILEHWHTGSMTRRSSTLDDIEPEAIACLNANDLQRMSIKPGNSIKVSTRRGDISLKARQDKDIPEGMIFIPFCFSEAAANILTNPELDPVGKIPEFKFCAAKVEPSSHLD